MVRKPKTDKLDTPIRKHQEFLYHRKQSDKGYLETVVNNLLGELVIQTNTLYYQHQVDSALKEAKSSFNRSSYKSEDRGRGVKAVEVELPILAKNIAELVVAFFINISNELQAK